MIWCPCLGTDSSRHNRVGTGRGGAAGPGGDQRGHGEGGQHRITRVTRHVCHVPGHGALHLAGGGARGAAAGGGLGGRAGGRQAAQHRGALHPRRRGGR